ncbi:MAG: HWE histidine kinase domain-containing protein [Rhodospirillaceae bacterium]
MPSREIDRAHLFEVLPTPLMVLDRELRFVDMNQAYLDVTLRTREDLLGSYVFDAFPETGERLERFRDAFERALNGEENKLVETPFSIPAPEKDGGGFREVYWTCVHTPVRNRAGDVTFMVQHAEDVTEQVRMARRNRVISKELDHRVKNLLAVVASIGRRTARGAASVDEFLDKFDGRLEAIARTHSTLADNDWDGMPLRQLVEAELEPFREGAGRNIAVEGPDLTLPPKYAQALSMTFHELATNAVKHGALGTETGQLSVSWRREAEAGHWVVEWRESGLSDLQEPATVGFGRVVLDEVTPVQVGAKVACRFEPTGIVCTILFHLPPAAND